MKISYNQIEEQCNELHNTAKQMEEIVSFICNESKKIISDASWNGEAADYFLNKVKKSSDGFSSIFMELENSILFLASCAEGYKEIDSKVSSEICNSLGISTPNLSTSKIFNR